MRNDEFVKSSIINNDIDKQNIIIKWIKEKINKTSIKFELIFKMSEYGPDPLNFHKTCDNKGPTLVLVKTKNNKIFGGFTPLNWKNSGRYICDNSNQTFIFSLNLMKKYDMINNQRAIFCDSRGPCFGGEDFDLGYDMKKGITYAQEGCSFLSNNNLELTGGKGGSEYFETEEFEVFKLLY